MNEMALVEQAERAAATVLDRIARLDVGPTIPRPWSVLADGVAPRPLCYGGTRHATEGHGRLCWRRTGPTPWAPDRQPVGRVRDMTRVERRG